MVRYNYSTETFAIGVSRRRAYFTVILHVLASIACWQNSLPVEIRLVLIAVLMIGLSIDLINYNKNYIRLRFSEQSGWEMFPKNGAWSPVEIGRDSVLTRWAMVLYLMAEDRQRIIVVFNDALADMEYRKLLMLVKTSVQ